MAIDIVALGARVERLMIERRLSARALSCAARLSHSYVSNLFAGHIRNPGLDAVEKLANALDVRPSVILGEDEA
jgi:transcriptional regulator with XRE-family HTH domain